MLVLFLAEIDVKNRTGKSLSSSQLLVMQLLVS